MNGRRPTGLERYFLGRVAEGLYTNFQVAAQYSHAIDKLLLANALKELVPRFSTLQIGVEKIQGSVDDGHYTNYNIAPVKTVLFEDVVEIRNEEYSDATARYIQKKSCPLVATVPTWRVILFSNNYISFYNNHIFFDGIASVNFHRELCKIFNNLSGRSLSFQTVLFESENYVPHTPVYELVDEYNSSFYDTVASWSSQLLPKSISQLISYYWGSDYLKYPFITKTVNRDTDILYLNLKLSGAKLERVLAWCRNHQVSLTSFLVVVLNYCLQEVIISKLSASPLSTKTVVAVNGRRHHPEKALVLENFISGASVPLEPLTFLDANQLIDKSQRVNSCIKQQIQSKDSFKTFGRLNHVNIRDALHVGAKELRSVAIFEISNLGFHNIVEGDWNITDLQISQGGCTGAFMKASVVSTPAGINISIDHQDEISAAQKSRLAGLFYLLIDTFTG